MLDTSRLKNLKRLGLVGGAFLLMLLSYGFGAMGKNNKNEITQPQKTQVKNEVRLSQEIVKEFLIAYYTKKDLEENRNRYEPLMTQTMFNQEVDYENKPIAQTYKGYVVDFQFKDADIYIDEEKLTALVKVRYDNVLLSKKGNYDESQTVTNEDSLKLDFVKEGNTYLVNQKTPFTISSYYEESNNYPNYGQLAVSEEKEENDEQETEPEGSGTESDQD